MADFTPITTQEQFDAAIGERLARERAALAKKLDGYDALKTRAADAERQLAELQKTAQEDAQRYADYDRTLAGLQAKVKGYETDALKTRVALDTGLPYAMAWRLAGESEAELRRDAEALASLMAGQRPRTAPPLRTHDPVGGPSGSGDHNEAMRSLAQQLTGKD